MRRASLQTFLVVCLWCVGGGSGFAQPATPGARRGSWEASGGVLYAGGYDLGERAAELTRNSATTTNPFEQFTTSSRVTGVAGWLGRFGYYLTNSLAIEGGFHFLQPVLEIRVTADAEEAPDVTAEEALERYGFDVSAVWHLSGMAFSQGRGVPFVTGGAGYLRELHEGDELVETGTTFQVGGGFKYWFGASRQIGLRGDVGVLWRDGGVDFEEGVRIVPTAGATVVFVF